MKLVEKQALDQCAAEYKKTKDELTKWEAEYVGKIEACRKEQEQLNCQIKQVHERVCYYTSLWLPKVLGIGAPSAPLLHHSLLKHSLK